MIFLKYLKIMLMLLIFGAGMYYSVHYFIDALHGLLPNIEEFVKSLIYEKQIYLKEVIWQFLKIFATSLSGFLFFILFSSGLSALLFKRPDNFKRLPHWELYRYYVSFFPLIITISGIILFILLSFVFFNNLASLLAFNVQLGAFILTFLLLNLLFIPIIALIYALYRLFRCQNGAQIAALQPVYTNQVIANKFINTPINTFNTSLYIAFFMLLGMEMIFFNNFSFFPLFLSNLFSYSGIRYLSAKNTST